MLIKCQACEHDISPEASNCPSCGHPVKPAAKKEKLLGCWTISALIIAGLIFIGVVGAAIDPKSETPPKASANSILDDATFQAQNPKFVAGIRSLILSEGLECPAIAQLWNQGESPLGLKLEALCGPDTGKRDSYSNLHYTVYPTRLKVVVCKPFGILAGGCE